MTSDDWDGNDRGRQIFSFEDGQSVWGSRIIDLDTYQGGEGNDTLELRADNSPSVILTLQKFQA